MTGTGFLDLPPELRNLVYEDVLAHDRPRGLFANVALLRTCRLINSEAQSVLRAQGCTVELSCVLINDPDSGIHDGRMIVLGGDIPVALYRYHKTLAFAQCSPILKASKIKLMIRFGYRPRGFPGEDLHHFFVALRNLLCLHPKVVEKVLVGADFDKFQGASTRFLEEFKKVLYPLLRINARTLIEFKDFPDCIMQDDAQMGKGFKSLNEEREAIGHGDSDESIIAQKMKEFDDKLMAIKRSWR